MKAFSLKVLLLLVIFLVLTYSSVMVLSWWPYRNYVPDGRYTTSKLVSMPENEAFDLLILGGSHGEVLTKGPAYDSVANILQQKFLNLSKGSGSGIVPMAMFADYFFYKGNSTKEVVYIFDDQLLFTDLFNEKPLFLRTEPFNLKFFQLGLKHHIKESAMAEYYQYKFGITWLGIDPAYDAVKFYEQNALTGIDTHAVTLRLGNMYFDDLDTAIVPHYEQLFIELLTGLQDRGIKVSIVVPPVLLGETPGKPYQDRLLKRLNDEYHIPSLVLSDTMMDPALFADHDHLNANGTAIMLRQYVKPFLDSQTGKK